MTQRPNCHNSRDVSQFQLLFVCFSHVSTGINKHITAIKQAFNDTELDHLQISFICKNTVLLNFTRQTFRHFFVMTKYVKVRWFCANKALRSRLRKKKKKKKAEKHKYKINFPVLISAQKPAVIPSLYLATFPQHFYFPSIQCSQKTKPSSGQRTYSCF